MSGRRSSLGDAEVVRLPDRTEAGVVSADELTVAQDRSASGLERPHLRLQAEFVDEDAHVSVAAGNELRAAVDDEVAVALAAHAAAGRVVALEHLDVEAVFLERVGGGEAGDASTDDDDLLRHGGSVSSCGTRTADCTKRGRSCACDGASVTL
jgi:hypothetical protein